MSSDLRIGLATLPAAQITVWVGMVQPAATTEPGRMSVTKVSVRTSTPSRRSSSLALSLRLGGYEGSSAGSAFQEQDGGFARIDVAEVAAERVAAELRHRSGGFHPGGAAAHDHKGQIRVPAHRVGLPLGPLEGEEHPLPDLDAHPRCS